MGKEEKRELIRGPCPDCKKESDFKYRGKQTDDILSANVPLHLYDCLNCGQTITTFQKIRERFEKMAKGVCPECKDIKTFIYGGIQNSLPKNSLKRPFEIYQCKDCGSSISENRIKEIRKYFG